MVRSGCPLRANALYTFALVFSFGLTGPAAAGVNEFTAVGPQGGGVNDLAWHPTDANIVYAATNGGIYRSTDGGQHWQLVHDRMVEAPRALAVHPSQPDRVFAAGFNSGVLTSTDAGATWTALGSVSPMTDPAWDIEYSPDGTTLYMATTRHVLRSTDNGATWQRGGSVSPTINMIHTLLVDNADPQVLYVTASTEGFRSIDGGASWQPWNMPATDVQDFAMVGSRIWASCYAGTFFSDNRGTSWTSALAGPSMDVTVDPNDPQIIYSATFNGVQRSTDNGAHWTVISGSVAAGTSDDVGFPTALVVDRSDPDHLLISGSSGISATLDGGASWRESHGGIHALGASELINAPGSDRIYVQAPYEGIFAIAASDGSSVALNNRRLRQLDGSDAGTVDTFSLMVLPDTTDRLFAGLIRGVARSADGGATWTAQSDPDFFNDIVRKIVSVSGDQQRLLAMAPERGLFESVDGGMNWSPLSSVSAYYMNELASAPSNPQTLYLVARVEIATNEAAFLRSFDGGASWSSAPVPDTGAVTLVVDPTNDRTVYISSVYGGFYKTTNGGNTWARLPVPVNPQVIWGIAIDPQNPDILYIATADRISRSIDGGQSWQTLLDDGARIGYAYSLAIDAQRPHNVYTSIAGHGVEQISIRPDLELTATTPAGPAANNTYSFRARNAGPFAASNVRTRVQLPAGATDVSATSTNGSCTVAANVVTCVSSALPVTGYADITINSSQPSAGTYEATAAVEGDQPDSNLANNSITSTVVIAEGADLSVALDAPSQVVRGQSITFSLTVSNAGPSSAASPTVSFTLAAGPSITTVTPSTNCTTAGTTVTCQLVTLAANASTSFSISSAATPAIGSYSGTATLTSNGADPVASNDSATRSVSVVEPVAGIGGGSGGGSSGGGSAPPSGGGGGGGGSVSPWMLLALLWLSAARPVRRPRRA